MRKPIVFRLRPGARRGSALIMAMVFAGLLAILSVGMMTRATANVNLAENSRERIQALLLAQAGISDALARLKTNKGKVVPYNVQPNSPPERVLDQIWAPPGTAFADSEQRYTVDEIQLDANGHYKLVATGIVHRVTGGSTVKCSRKIESICLYKTGQTRGPFPFMFGKDFFNLDSPNDIDSFDSRGIAQYNPDGTPKLDAQGNPVFTPASYNTQASQPGFHTDPKLGGMNANIGTNGNITISGSLNGKLYGTPSYGYTPPGAPPHSANTSAYAITGATMNPGVVVLPDVSALVTPPPGMPISPGVPALSANNKYTFRLSTITSGFSVPAGAQVTIYLDGNLSLAGTPIAIGAGANLTILQASGSVDIPAAATGFTYGTDPKTQPYSTANQLTFVSNASGPQNWSGGSSEWNGTIYSPNAPITFGVNGAPTGALIGKSLSFGSGTQFNFDTGAMSPAFVQTPVSNILSAREVPSDF